MPQEMFHMEILIIITGVFLSICSFAWGVWDHDAKKRDAESAQWRLEHPDLADYQEAQFAKALAESRKGPVSTRSVEVITNYRKIRDSQPPTTEYRG